MAECAGSCEEAGGLAVFRRELHGCFTRRADALFELGDAVLAARKAVSLPYLSEELSFRRSYGMVYQGLAEGRIDEDGLRDLLVRWRPAEWPCVFGTDASRSEGRRVGEGCRARTA